MKRIAIALGATTALALLTAGCVEGGYYEGGYASRSVGYTNCDYYAPPWGYPPDYCRYRLWNQPVYYGGVWFSGPIYYRADGGANTFWLNGGWRHNEWNKPSPPRINWNNGRNQRWQGVPVMAEIADQDGADRTRVLSRDTEFLVGFWNETAPG